MLLRTAPTALLALALLTACSGGDGGSDGGSGGADADGLPKAEFVTQAEAICTQANAQLEAEPQPTSPAGIEPYFDALVRIADDTTTELEELAADQSDKAEVDRIFLTPLRGQVSAIESYLPTAKEALRQGEQAFAQLSPPALPEADVEAMKEYGFEACVETAQAG